MGITVNKASNYIIEAQEVVQQPRGTAIHKH